MKKDFRSYQSLSLIHIWETIMDYNKMINDEVQSMRKKFGLD